MIEWAAALLLMGTAVPEAAEPAPQTLKLAQVVIRRQIIVRVRPKRSAQAPMIAWVETKGPRCVPARAVRGAALLGQNRVDLLLADNSRLRARLERSCPALDYYHGFYIRPDEDGLICADRDVVRSRMGGECEIEQFRILKPKTYTQATARD